MASWLTDGMVRIQAFRVFCIIVFLRKGLRGILKKLAICQPTTWLDLLLSPCPVARGGGRFLRLTDKHKIRRKLRSHLLEHKKGICR